MLVASRIQDPPEKVGFADDHWLKVEGGRAVAEVVGDVVDLAIALRNVGNGLAVLDRWDFYGERVTGDERRSPESFHRLTRDLYVPAGELGFGKAPSGTPTTRGMPKPSPPSRNVGR